MQQSYKEFSEKQMRVELKSVGNFVVKTVLVESANQFLLEELCTVQLEIFFEAIRPSGKTVTRMVLFLKSTNI